MKNRVMLSFFTIFMLNIQSVVAGTIPLQLEEGQLMPTLAPLVEKVAPAVVSISLFNDQGRILSVGSGVVVDAEQGLILSNHHVIGNAERIKVDLSDDRSFDAELIGSDPAVDIALLKIEATALTALPLVDSDELRVGDFVLAIGNPFGLGHSVASGIVSALERTGLGLERYENFIQIDATINPGNSGGALVNLRGELVGINTAVVAPKGGNSVGIGFAIPSNVARTISMHLARNGRVSRGNLGIAVQDLTPELKAIFNVSAETEGVLVNEVKSGSSAEKAGLKVGDIVTRINKRMIDSVDNLRMRLGLLTLNPQLEIDFIREGATQTALAKIQTAAPISKGKVQILRFAGAALAEDQINHGLRVKRLESESIAAQAGLMKNDLVLELNRRGVSTLQEFVKDIDPQVNLLLIQRGPSTSYIVLKADQ